MTRHHPTTGRVPTADRLAQRAARAAREVEGVAYLRPGLAALLRGADHPRPAGVRVRHRTEPERWAIELHLAVLAGHRALDVARTVRAAVAEAARETLPARARLSVKVTITNIT
ncbi:Asp23/Gls24 family envelope stress response protein [Streptomyces hainanensis]|uniref:Asp23/Gls24 family envelope stress response protein n=1 Tax=Streptomyces hainanensis TaxID=402648 RepID=A0A4R4SKY1_9ACTN|nr:Asp23/Gls24 family envelope stress response protein [Streptomyces hainanensis]TDC63446.1 Asp23/Gls24 family envelope stress response protein [Streptomyces hainanensis]